VLKTGIMGSDYGNNLNPMPRTYGTVDIDDGMKLYKLF
jgi:hypothetical protein